MVGTLIIAGLLIAAGIVFPSVSLPVWGLALCSLAWGLKDVIPYPKSYDSDYVERYLAAQEEARIKRMGSGTDLGAAHDADCDADDLKKSHVRRHNTNGVNREMFR